MNDISLMKSVLEYFTGVNNIVAKLHLNRNPNIRYVSLDLQFYFETREKDMWKLLHLGRRNNNETLEFQFIPNFEWLVYDFRELVDESESNDNAWQSEINHFKDMISNMHRIFKREEFMNNED